MKQRSRTWLALGLMALCSLPNSADAGAWAQPKGQHYVKLSGIFYKADQHFNGDGTRESLGSLDEAFYADQGFLYVEYTLIGDGGLTSVMNSMSMQVSEGDFVKWALNAAVNVYGPLWVDLLYEEIFAGKNVGAGRSLGFGFAWR